MPAATWPAQWLLTAFVVICAERRDGSAALSLVRDPKSHDTCHLVPYVCIPHTQTLETWEARNRQLCIRLWELGLISEASLGKSIAARNNSWDPQPPTLLLTPRPTRPHARQGPPATSSAHLPHGVRSRLALPTARAPPGRVLRTQRARAACSSCRRTASPWRGRRGRIWRRMTRAPGIGRVVWARMVGQGGRGEGAVRRLGKRTWAGRWSRRWRRGWLR
ncbi:hypothetical protein VTK26DRAFT_626 [Humicola hyalothermophila]